MSLATPERTSRKRSASWLEITYPFSSDEDLRHHYMLADGDSLRVGMFLEELDAFSADCAFRHADASNPERPLTVVTAAHDGLSIFNSLSARHDLRLRGTVVSVGSSSMEVQTDLLRVTRAGAAEEEEKEEYLGSCFTVMVARDRTMHGKAEVHSLQGGDPVSDEMSLEAKRRSDRRRYLIKNALALKPPDPSEVPLVHELWRAARGKGLQRTSAGSDSESESQRGLLRVPMADTEQRALDIMQPAHRNMNGFMFGGYLMRRALEVGWLSAFRFGQRPASFAGLDDVIFMKPVEVGHLLEFVGRVVYVTEEEKEEEDKELEGEGGGGGGAQSLRVCVEAHKVSLRTGAREPTNEFHFVFRAPPPQVEQGEAAATVQPESYEEMMLFLEGRRRAT